MFNRLGKVDGKATKHIMIGTHIIAEHDNSIKFNLDDAGLGKALVEVLKTFGETNPLVAW